MSPDFDLICTVHCLILNLHRFLLGFSINIQPRLTIFGPQVGFTGVIPGAMQVACFAYDWWEDQVYPLFMILPINIHDFWLAISGYFLQI
jgi:hypothetical protein